MPNSIDFFPVYYLNGKFLTKLKYHPIFFDIFDMFFGIKNKLHVLHGGKRSYNDFLKTIGRLTENI